MWKTAEPIVALANRSQLEKMIAEVENKMKKAAKDLDFITAAQFRDEMMALKKTFREKFPPRVVFVSPPTTPHRRACVFFDHAHAT